MNGSRVCCRLILLMVCPTTLFSQDSLSKDPRPGASGNAENVRFINGRDGKGNPVRLARRTGHVSNYTESKVADYSLPDPLVSFDGEKVTTKEEWAIRKTEILRFYQEQIYGKVPANAPKVKWKVVEEKENSRAGAKVTRKIVGTFENESTPALRLTLHLPEKTGPVPVLLHLSFFSGDVPRRFSKKGNRNEFDSVAEVLNAGWAYAQIGYNDIQPDRAEQWHYGVIGQALPKSQERPAKNEWGTISAWAWGVSRIIDLLEKDPAIDRQRIALTGASRLGKTSLWAAAQDERIASVFSVVPGEMGASLIRRDWGETLDDMAQNFPWQFAGNVQNWVGKWNELPVDQHLLIATIAPRAVYINGGLSDQWSDPKGEFLAMVAAEPVYQLLGATGLGTRTLPRLDKPIIGKHLAFHYHSKGHQAVPDDWRYFLKFANDFYKSRKTKPPQRESQ